MHTEHSSNLSSTRGYLVAAGAVLIALSALAQPAQAQSREQQTVEKVEKIVAMTDDLGAWERYSCKTFVETLARRLEDLVRLVEPAGQVVRSRQRAQSAGVAHSIAELLVEFNGVADGATGSCAAWRPTHTQDMTALTARGKRLERLVKV
jgi:hypothetical protein